jgi:hypothetical protein
MRLGNGLLAMLAGVGLGMAGMLLIQGPTKPVAAAANDRYQDFVMCTGSVAVNPRAPTDGVWLLDYRSGKLLGTVIDRTAGKIAGWAEVDLVNELGIPPKQDVHFMMATGSIANGQAALYLAEVSTGKFGVYTMGPSPEGQGIIIRRHDLTTFRAKENPAKDAVKVNK